MYKDLDGHQMVQLILQIIYKDAIDNRVQRKIHVDWDVFIYRLMIGLRG